MRVDVPVRVQSFASMSPSQEHPAAGPTPLHIDRAAGPEIDLTTTGYSVTFGGSKDAVGTVLLRSPAGLEALRRFSASSDSRRLRSRPHAGCCPSKRTTSFQM